MATTVSQNQRGFTLIEMSIVLVIIGLIIGGILKGQELIESSRQKNFISQIDAIRAASNAFQDRYRAFPGDYGRATSAIAGCGALCVNGNDDGLLNTTPGATTANLAGFDGTQAIVTGTETWEFFEHLLAANLLGGGGLTNGATAQTGFSGGTSISPLPQIAFPQAGLTIVYGTHAGNSANGTPITGHWLRAQRFGNAANSTATAVISPNRMYALDLKYDDGQAVTGTIRSSDAATGCNTAGKDDYISTTTSLACHIFMPLE